MSDLHPLLDRALDQAPEFLSAKKANTEPDPPGGGAYTNHVPMVLHALTALGASTAQLHKAARLHAAHIPPRVAWPALQAAEQQLLQQIAQQGAEAVLRKALPERMGHAGAMAFHGLIRTAHAWQSGHPRELALALAWWQQRDQALPTKRATKDAALPLADWVAALWALPTPPDLPPAWIAARMLSWCRTPGFAQVAPRLALTPQTLQALAAWALAAYAQGGDFTVLHMATACHAMAALGPLMPPEATTQALRDFTLHAAAALLASRWRGETAAALPDQDWPTLIAQAHDASDDHAIKLVHAAWDWQQRGLDDALCRLAATRALQRT